MISFLQGTILSKQNNKVVLLTKGGVGYEMNVSTPFFLDLNIGQDIDLHTYLKVSENALTLFGFQTSEKKEFFELLLSVKGVGPKGALNILGLGSIEEIKNAISRSDVSYLTQVSGMGKRTAERLCVELKEKIKRSKDQKIGDKIVGDKLGEVIDGLVSMGYNKEEARVAIQGLESKGKTTEELMKEALKKRNTKFF